MKKCNNCGREYKCDDDYLRFSSGWNICSSENLWFNCTCGSTLVIVKGKYPWYSPDLLMSERAQSVFNEIVDLRGLPRIPTKLQQIRQLITTPNIDPKILEAEIRKEPLLAANVIRAGLDAKKFRTKELRSKELSLLHAINYLGTDFLQTLIISTSVEAIAGEDSCIDQKEFWEKSYMTANISAYLADKIPSPIEPDSAYITCLFINIGKLAMSLTLPDSTKKICDKIDDPKYSKNWFEIETELGAFHHTVIGEIAAIIWGVPKYCLPAIRMHHTPNLNRDIHTQLEMTLILIAQAANQFAHWTNLQPELLDENFLDSLLKKLKIPCSNLDDFANEITYYIRSLNT